MTSRQKVLFLALPTFFYYPCFGQGMVEMSGTHAGVVGLGSELSASGKNHGHAAGRLYESAAASLGRVSSTSNDASASSNRGRVASAQYSHQALFQTSAVATNQSKVIEQYMKIGNNFELKRHWTEAEESYKYVLRIIASRDGPGSLQSVPVLEHLVVVNQAQDKLNDAISLQKTVINFKKVASGQNFGPIVNAQNNLARLYEMRGDYISAEPLLKESVALCYTYQSSISSDQRHVTVDSYVRVLRKLKKNVEADVIENEYSTN